MKRYMLLLTGLLSFHGVSHAELSELGNELVYDSAQNITWMQDVNLVKTACDASAAGTAGAEKALWDVFSNVQPNITPALESGRTPGQICADNGKMNWHEASLWVGLLNIQEYHGYHGWRLPDTPTTNANDPSCVGDGFLSPDQYECTGSELGHLFTQAPTDGLGNASDANGCVLGCFTSVTPFTVRYIDVGLFVVVQDYIFWSTQSFSDTDKAYYFSTDTGKQATDNKKDDFNHIWPVRHGLSLADSGDCLGDGEINIQDVICTINKVLAAP